MKKIIISLLVIVAVLGAVSFGGLKLFEGKVSEVSADLNDRIATLDGEIAELEDEIASLNGKIDALENENAALGAGKSALEAEKAALKTEKAALEEEKAALEAEKVALEAEKAVLEGEKAELSGRLDEIEKEIICTSGVHFYDGESEIKYSWSTDQSFCIAEFACSACGKLASISTYDVTREGDSVTAYFNDNIPSTVYDLPVFTGVYFNSDSEGYDEATNTFIVTEETPFVLTFTGKNLLNINADNEHIVYANYNGMLDLMDYVSKSERYVSSVTDTAITVTINAAILSTTTVFTEFVMYDENPNVAYENTRIAVTVLEDPLPVDDEGYTLVSDMPQLSKALLLGGKIRLTADIESKDAYFTNTDFVLDLAGYDITIAEAGYYTLYVNGLCVELCDSVGGSSLSSGICVYQNSTIKISDAVAIGSVGMRLMGGLDLSDYSGEGLEVYLYDSTSELLLPDGYAMYDVNGEPVTNLNIAIIKGYVSVRPAEQGSDTEEPTPDPEEPTESNGFPVFTLPTEPKANFADYNIPISDILAFFPSEVEMNYEGGVFTVKDIGATSVSVYDLTTVQRTDLTLTDGVWTGEAELDLTNGIGVDFHGQAGDNSWYIQYEKGKIAGLLRVNSGSQGKALYVNYDNNTYFLQFECGNALISELTYSDGQLIQEKIAWLAPDSSHYVDVIYDSNNEFVMAIVVVLSPSGYYYYFPEGWSVFFEEYVEGGDVAPGFENYTVEDFVTLCPSALG